jgi:deazaflavin-dependent oxidoreductase (nitroreductase family)
MADRGWVQAWSEKVYFFMEYWISVTFLKRRPGGLVRALLRLPILAYRMGWGGLMAGQVLILTTTGRKTRRLRQTALEYGYDADADTYTVGTGWSGRADWFRNAQAEPQVEVWVGRRRCKALAEVAPVEENARQLLERLNTNPYLVKIYERLTGIPNDGSLAWRLQMAEVFPLLVIHPVKS